MRHSIIALFIYIYIYSFFYGCATVDTTIKSSTQDIVNENVDHNIMPPFNYNKTIDLNCPKNTEFFWYFLPDQEGKTNEGTMLFVCIDEKKTEVRTPFRQYYVNSKETYYEITGIYIKGDIIGEDKFIGELVRWNPEGSLDTLINIDANGQKTGWVLQRSEDGWVAALYNKDIIDNYKLFFDEDLNLVFIEVYSISADNHPLYGKSRSELNEIFITEQEGFFRYIIQQLDADNF